MQDLNSSDVTLGSVDTTVLSCWEMMKQGADCSLHLEHRKGVITTILKCSSIRKTFDAKGIPSSKHSQAENKKKKQGSEKKLHSLLAYDQRLVQEKGLPPCNLMLQHAAVTSPQSSANIESENQFNCEFCEFQSPSKHGVDIHTRGKHKLQEHEEPELLRTAEQNVSLDMLEVTEKRKEVIPPPEANST